MPQPLGEFARIDRFLKPLSAGLRGALGLTDDAGRIRVPSGHDLVVTVDAIVEGVHFLADDPPHAVAQKALRVNLSDLAAKGARPYAYLLTCALPRHCDESWLSGFCAGLAADQAQYAIALLGGDSVGTPGPAMISITAHGLVPSDGMVLRSGARPGDFACVTGTIGDARLGLMALQGTLPPSIAEADRAGLIARYRLPKPRTALAEALRRYATAALDVSDGLIADLSHLAQQSGVCIAIEADRVPLSEAAKRTIEAGGADRLRLFTGGDDYEIAFTLPPNAWPAMQSAAALAGVPVHKVGIVAAAETDAAAVTLRDAAGDRIALEGTTGWQH